ncbi:PREDICTED: coiled-coil domain-containing protein 92-like [Priapulus caudatus]|uniref:Coiled-coil domain-containing protein 92-like n=1 Tax=Priapulus caudatus TaxID=37621 RepID=A0ABM1DRU8_PRICU|nr:PREDICTED: coiled-coil domain-containing protein 92-like [Priapulus caudatus]
MPLFVMIVVTDTIYNTSISDFTRKQVEALDEQLTLEKRRALELRDDIEKRDRRIRILEQQLKAKDKQYIQELKGVKAEISVLHKELDQKSSMIAYLTTQLHQAKINNRSREQLQKSGTTSTTTTVSMTNLNTHARTPASQSSRLRAPSTSRLPTSPTPPRSPWPDRTTVRRSWHGQKYVPIGSKGVENAAPVNGGGARAKPSAGFARHSTSPARSKQGSPQGSPQASKSTSVVPDPAPFLAHPDPAKPAHQKSVLPPINVTNALVNKAVGGGRSLIVKKCPLRPGSRERKVETIAVDVTAANIQPSQNSPPTDAS